jgi:hypothetical protein
MLYVCVMRAACCVLLSRQYELVEPIPSAMEGWPNDSTSYWKKLVMLVKGGGEGPSGIMQPFPIDAPQ